MHSHVPVLFSLIPELVAKIQIYNRDVKIAVQQYLTILLSLE